jgi:hypothetical protein
MIGRYPEEDVPQWHGGSFPLRISRYRNDLLRAKPARLGTPRNGAMRTGAPKVNAAQPPPKSLQYRLTRMDMEPRTGDLAEWLAPCF